MKWKEIFELLKNLVEFATAITSLIAVIIARRTNKGKPYKRQKVRRRK